MEFENRLVTTQQFAEAKRHSLRVKAININDGELEAVGVILLVDNDHVQILDESVGVVRLLRENNAVYLAPRPVN